MRLKFKSEYIDDVVDVNFGTYPNGQKAIYLTDAETGEPVATLTASLPWNIPDDCVYIKSYSENKGVIEEVLRQGFGTIEAFQENGFATFPVLRLSETLLALTD